LQLLTIRFVTWFLFFFFFFFFFFLQFFGGNGLVFFEEESIVDPRSKVMTLKGRNISFHEVIELEETCTYNVSHENPEWFASFSFSFSFSPFEAAQLTNHRLMTLGRISHKRCK